MARQGGFGAKFKIKVNTSLVAVAHVEDFSFPKEEAKTDDMTAHDSPGGFVERIKTGMRELKAFDVTLGWDRGESTHDALVAAYQSDDPVEVSVEDAKGAEVMQFNANIISLERVVAKDKHLTCKVGVEPTGGPTGATAESV
jgi:hypothetical protein